jgi:DNA-binding FrmR family transcriptional regulator
MVEQDRYCIDILTQVAAASRALQGVALTLLDDHMRHCLVDAGSPASQSMVDEASEAIARLVRSG